jgi:hypothetical protein
VKRAAVLVIAACSRGPVTTCDDDLRGVYAVAGSAERWMVLDDATTLEAYPLFPDGGGVPGLEVGPRMIELARTSGAIAGTVRKRYLERAARCDAKLAVHVTRCAADTLELVLADPAPPTTFTPCTWPRPGSSRIERWRRE